MRFRSPVDGDPVLLTPESSIAVQTALDSDIVMVFDECTPYPASEAVARDVDGAVRALGGAQPRRVRPRSATRTRCSASSRAARGRRCAPRRSTRSSRIGFDGYAIGGLAVGEPAEERDAVLEALDPQMPDGSPALPDGGRHAGRHRAGRGARHRHVRLRHADPQRPQRAPVHDRRAWSGSATPRTRTTCARSTPAAAAIPAATTPGPICVTWTAATRSSGARLNTIHNLHYYLGLMGRIRSAIERGRYGEFRAELPRRAGGGIVVRRQPAGRSGIIARLFSDAPRGRAQQEFP